LRLTIFRHGIAIDQTDPDCPVDPERRLTEVGLRRTRAASLGLRSIGVSPDLVLTSPYVRARQTAEIAAEVCGYPRNRIETREELVPFGNAHKLLRSLTDVPALDVLCVGHNPNLADLLAVVLGEPDRHLAMLKKAGAACVEVTEPGRLPGRLLWLLEPRMLRQLGTSGASAGVAE
jgi:phosphohistidine phosphatase